MHVGALDPRTRPGSREQPSLRYPALAYHPESPSPLRPSPAPRTTSAPHANRPAHRCRLDKPSPISTPGHAELDLEAGPGVGHLHAGVAGDGTVDDEDERLAGELG